MSEEQADDVLYGSDDEEKSGLSIDDVSLPRTVVSRLAKSVLENHTPVQREALTAISRSATVFASYLVSHANERAKEGNRRTVQAKDVLEAVADVEFAIFLPRLEAELRKYHELQISKRKLKSGTLQASQARGKAIADAATHPDSSRPSAHRITSYGKRVRLSTNEGENDAGAGTEMTREENKEEVEVADITDTSEDADDNPDSQSDAGSHSDDAEDGKAVTQAEEEEEEEEESESETDPDSADEKSELENRIGDDDSTGSE